MLLGASTLLRASTGTLGAPPLLCASIQWVPLTAGPCCQSSGCMDRVHLAVVPEWKFDFLYLFFIDFVANLQKLYLELGVSKWGEPS